MSHQQGTSSMPMSSNGTISATAAASTRTLGDRITSGFAFRRRAMPATPRRVPRHHASEDALQESKTNVGKTGTHNSYPRATSGQKHELYKLEIHAKDGTDHRLTEAECKEMIVEAGGRIVEDRIFPGGIIFDMENGINRVPLLPLVDGAGTKGGGHIEISPVVQYDGLSMHPSRMPTSRGKGKLIELPQRISKFFSMSKLTIPPPTGRHLAVEGKTYTLSRQPSRLSLKSAGESECDPNLGTMREGSRRTESAASSLGASFSTFRPNKTPQPSPRTQGSDSDWQSTVGSTSAASASSSAASRTKHVLNKIRPNFEEWDQLRTSLIHGSPHGKE